MAVKAETLFVLLLLGGSIIGCTSRKDYETKPTHATVNAININTATVDELDTLPNIGRKTAEAIVEFRTQNGPFRRPEQLLQIRGVSEERFAEIRPLIKTE